jgi:RNA polymerase sigma factor (sigma-70 family)
MAAPPLRTLIRRIAEMSGAPCKPQAPDWQLLEDFSARHDEAAFAELVARHGSMVLRVCRRVLHHEQDAEDAFQASFLVLARRSESIRKHEALANWLHGVAYRTAMTAKRSTARRRNHEARLRERTSSETASQTWNEVQGILDEEIQRLPSSFRSTFVLCVLEGKTIAAAAAELSCKEGTVASRLARARLRLQQQLSRRGIELSALLAALCVAEGAVQAAVPRALAQTAVRAAVLIASGGTTAGLISAHVANLATGVIRAMFLQKAKIATVLLLTLGLFATGAGVVTHQVLAAREQTVENQKSEDKRPEPLAAQVTPQPPAEKPKPQATDDQDAIAYSGRVLGPDGKAVTGAKLYVAPSNWRYLAEPYESPEVATTGSDGRFQFTVSKGKLGESITVAAAKAEYGVGWLQIPAKGKKDDFTLRLVEDDVPVTGQIVDLQGKPAPGVTLRLQEIFAAVDDNLDPWLEAATVNKRQDIFQLESLYLKRHCMAPAPVAKATTDADGRFRLSGIGRNRLAWVRLDGPTIVSERFYVLTRAGKSIELKQFEGAEFGHPCSVVTCYGASFRHAAAPSRPVVGVVRDKGTRLPIAGITIRSLLRAEDTGNLRDVEFVQTTTDAEGRYRLTGMPMGKGYKIAAVPKSDQPYVASHNSVPDSAGLSLATVNFDLKRGVWIEGKITDKVTGKPVRASLIYFSMSTNPNLRDYPGFDGFFSKGVVKPAVMKEVGHYRIIGLPGPGLIAVSSMHGLRADERDDEFRWEKGALDTSPYKLQNNYQGFKALARVDPAKNADGVKEDITLDPGWTFTGTVVSPDGKPLAGAREYGLTEFQTLKTAEFAVRAFNPRRPPDVYFRHVEKGLVGVAHPPKENGGSVMVRLEPGAAVRGRLVDADGKPRGGVEMYVYYRVKDEEWSSYLHDRVMSDKDGRFRIEALRVDKELILRDRLGQSFPIGPLQAGQTKDLGDVLMKVG